MPQSMSPTTTLRQRSYRSVSEWLDEEGQRVAGAAAAVIDSMRRRFIKVVGQHLLCVTVTIFFSRFRFRVSFAFLRS